MKILVCGLPSAGKTYLAERLKEKLSCAWFNADDIRGMSNDWDFSAQARIRQARRMRNIADFESVHNIVICDFVCPTKETRAIFAPKAIIWLDTVIQSKYDDTNQLFETPEKEEADYFYKIDAKYTAKQISAFANKLKSELNLDKWRSTIGL